MNEKHHALLKNRSSFDTLRMNGFWGVLLVLLAGNVWADAQVAWLRDGRVEMRALSGNAALPSHVPLGSLWKLFVYAYLADTHAHEPDYLVPAVLSEADRYCGEPNESISRDIALARSCAPYFLPARLSITPDAWQRYWQTRTAAAWLQNINQLQPDTRVPLASLLQALADISPLAQAEARQALLATSVQGYGREAWTRLGTGIRYKTYSWHDVAGNNIGGGAGWLVDGTPFWFGAAGASRSALTTWATTLAATLPSPRWQNTHETRCVDVDFFARYPLQSVWRGTAPAPAGHLRGAYRLQFANGNHLNIVAQGEMRLSSDQPPVITGRFGLNDYLARVIDREGNAQPAQAARALAIAARSYVLQNAAFTGGCWHIADASQTQRVSPNPPTDGALAAAWFTDELVLQGVAVRYHQTLAGENQLSWQAAVSQAGEGWDFERMLSHSYPQATLTTLNAQTECHRLIAAETWLTNAAAKWSPKLQREAGFEPLDTPPKICALNNGNPYSDQQRLRIYIRGWRSLNERITLAHEYLHLALRYHPNGADENYIERLARRLVEFGR
ncbi:MAG: DUF2300 domain-containing protein [Gallionella sp.]|nr:DUF2300 domain-containing protein [Gallionella sp.]MDD4959293.1 DUF2300 domain-containing protein [Gallionella sp.]